MKPFYDWSPRAQRFVLRCLIFVISAQVAPLVHAQTAPAWNEDNLSWTAPTACSDGTPLTNCPVTGYRIERASSPTATTWAFVATTSLTSYKATNVPAGQNCYRVAANSSNGMSAWAPVLASSCAIAAAPPPPPPAPPGSVTVTDVVAYEVRKNSSGVMVASRIGIVPTGTVCSQETRTVNSGSYPGTYNRIDPKAVDLINWPNRLPPTDVFARCAAG
jgi:hypothetical protein